MHKLYVVTRLDGSLLFVAVLNPGTPVDVGVMIRQRLVNASKPEDRVVVVPYATQVVASQPLGQLLMSWWTARKMKVQVAGE
jgi:hypothetical protein